MGEALTNLTMGPSQPIGSMRKSASGGGGVFTIWIGDSLVYFGVAGDVAETRPSNAAQADGVVGRIRKYAQQPGGSTIRRIQKNFPDHWEQHQQETPEKTARQVLRSLGRARIHRVADRVAADAVLNSIRNDLERALLHDCPQA